VEHYSTAKLGNDRGARKKRFLLGLGLIAFPIALLVLLPDRSLARAAITLHMDERLGPAFVGLFGMISQMVALWLFHGISRRPADRLSWCALVAAAFSVIAGLVCFAVIAASALQGW
jgi:hypothetical protein